MSVTVFDDHGEPDAATHTVTCRNPRCRKVAVAVVAPPLPGHVQAAARGRPKLREVIYCGECQQAIWWSEVRAKG